MAKFKSTHETGKTKYGSTSARFVIHATPPLSICVLASSVSIKIKLLLTFTK